jgi:cobalt-zinc-cadmium resistance protein CzcA
MFDRLIQASVRGRLLVLLVFVSVVAYGVHSYRQMPVDAFPDISPIMVPIFAEAHGMAPEEIERLIAYPIEASMNGLPDVTQIKSTSAFGMAVVYVYFRDDVDIYFARQLVAERLAAAMNDLPEMHDPPTLGPISTGLGQVFLYYLTLDPGADTQGKPPDAYLREVNDWVVSFQLQTVPGVTDVLSMGGHVLQFQIRVDPHALFKYGIDLESIVEAVQANNRNVGGQFLVVGAEEYLVRGLGLLGALEEIQAITLKTLNGVPITIGDVADVVYGKEIRRGVVLRNGEGEVVSGIVMKLYGENTSAVIDRLYAKITEVQAALPDGVRLTPYYEQAELVTKATDTVKEALLVGALLVIVTLAAFLGNFRSALIVILGLPFSTLIAVICMRWGGVSANLMSLGGIAVAIGMLNDGPIVMVENIYRHLGKRSGSAEARDVVIFEAAREVARPIVFSIAIIIMVFLPIFTLQDVEGKIFAGSDTGPGPLPPAARPRAGVHTPALAQVRLSAAVAGGPAFPEVGLRGGAGGVPGGARGGAVARHRVRSHAGGRQHSDRRGHGPIHVPREGHRHDSDDGADHHDLPGGPRGRFACRSARGGKPPPPGQLRGDPPRAAPAQRMDTIRGQGRAHRCPVRGARSLSRCPAQLHPAHPERLR